MNDTTPRDRVWMMVIDSLVNHDPIKKTAIVEEAGVAKGTAESVLHVAEDCGILYRDSPQAHTYNPADGEDIGGLRIEVLYEYLTDNYAIPNCPQCGSQFMRGHRPHHHEWECPDCSMWADKGDICSWILNM